mmetsp:Transcript_30844/g.86449  ORF Transcript_30844/g.86449 Transcript_30844/m.86449 type:complete len:120 (+) Transcript_30844:318-677(+)
MSGAHPRQRMKTSTLTWFPTTAQRDTMIYRNISTNATRFPNHNPISMINNQPPLQTSSGMDIHGEHLCAPRLYQKSQFFPILPPVIVRHSLQLCPLKPFEEAQRLKGVECRRVSLVKSA